MIFQIIEKIKLRLDTKKYFNDYIKINDYNLYFGFVNNYYSIIISNKEQYNNINLNLINWNDNNINLDELLSKINDKTLELCSEDFYIRINISLNLIEWLKADITIFTESNKDYNTISLPYINSILDKNIKWINDLVFNKSEEINVLFRNKNFVISKDISWKDMNPTHFYILAFPIKLIKTIRDLTIDDIPLLMEIKEKVLEIASHNNIDKEKLYMFFHYHPSYYQLHLHVCLINQIIHEITCYRNYFLDDIIEKLLNNTEYWNKATLQFELISGTKLFKLLQEKQNK